MSSTGCKISVRPFSGLKNEKRKREAEEGKGSSKRTKYLDSAIVIAPSSSKAAEHKDRTPAVTLICTHTTSHKRTHEDQDDHKTTKKVKVTSPARPNLSTSKGSGSSESSDRDKRSEFNSKYVEEKKLGKGGFGAVYAGRRVADNLPVAMKHIDQKKVRRIKVSVDGELMSVPQEVRLLQQLQGVPAVVKLLDWYNLPDELILVLERPDPCVDLMDFVRSSNDTLKECDAKIIAEQLVDALIQIHAHGVFHRDIKLKNILIETGSSIPRVRVIDFGCGTFLRKSYFGRAGTYQYRSPEWLLNNEYQAEPATVWQLGVALFRLLHGSYPYIATDLSVHIDIKPKFSKDCIDFLCHCFTQNPMDRATLQRLQQHPWLTSGSQPADSGPANRT